MPRPLIYTTIFCVYLVTAICFPFISFSQQLRWEFRNINTREGLPSSEVHKVLSDSRNFIWFATDHGVCRYDGYRIETLDLPDNSIITMYEDARKRIWFVSFSGRLFYYEEGKIYTYKHNKELLKALEQVVINGIYIDISENVYVSTVKPGCFKIDPRGRVEELFEPNPHTVFESIETENGEYFTYVKGHNESYDGIYFPFKKSVSSIIIRKGTGNTTIKFTHYIKERKSGTRRSRDGSWLFFSGDFLLKIYEDGSYTFIKTRSSILDLMEMADGKILVATIGDGLYLLDRYCKEIANYFHGLTVTSIEKDYENGMWFSTTQEGVFYLNSLEIKHLSEGQNIIHEKANCLAIVDDSTIWAGTENGNLLRLVSGKQFQKLNLPVNNIIRIHPDLKRDTVFLSVGRISFPGYRSQQLFFSRYNKDRLIIVMSIGGVIELQGEFFSGDAYKGILKLNFNDKISEEQNSRNFRVSKLFLDSRQNILIGNLFGLWYHRDGDLYPFDSTKEILRTRITDINEYKRKYLCLGTRGKGFLLYSTDSLYQFTTNEGLCSNNIRKIFIDGNIIWLATNNGISRLSIQSELPFTYTINNINTRDGLLSNEVNDIRKLDSSIIVATNSGISIFHEDLFTGKNELPLSFYFSGIRINGVDTVIRKSYRLNHRQRNLYLSFVALSYHENSEIEYRYRLTGIDSNWSYTSAREIQLNPLPYGRFTIEIQARRKEGDWGNANSLSLVMNCRPPFWKTIWFLAGIFLATAFLIILFFNRRTNMIREREKEKTLINKKLAEMEMKALRAQMNPHFIFNVLNSIQYYITHNDNEKAQYYLSKFAKLVRMTLDNSRVTFITLAEELLLLSLYIDLERIRFEGKFGYEIYVEEGIDTALVRIPNMLLQPYVENSIKHGFRIKSQGYFLKVSITEKNGNIICIIDDNGIGRDRASQYIGAEQEKHTSAGTVIIREKMEALRQYYNYNITSETIDLKDEGDNLAGTRVTLIFPAKFDFV